MRLKSRSIAKLLLLLSLLSNQQFPAEAQNQLLGRDRYPRVLSVVEDSSGNFLLLNLQSNGLLAAPSIQYLSGQDGQTVLVADFAGLVWSQGSKIVRPSNREIDSVRLGQFQDSPPIFRISVISSNPAAFKRLEFSNQGKSLLVKFGDQSRSIAQNSMSSPVIPPTWSRNRNRFEPVRSDSVPVSSQYPPYAPSTGTQKDRDGNAESKQPELVAVAEKISRTRITTATTKRVPSTTDSDKASGAAKTASSGNLPFKSGGLFMSLGSGNGSGNAPGPDSRSSDTAADTNKIESGKRPSAKTTTAPNMPPSAKTSSASNMPPLAKATRATDMPPTAPTIKPWPPIETDSTKKPEISNKTKNELISKLKKDIRANLGTELEKSESSKAESELAATSNLPNPTVEFVGKEPLKMKLKFNSKVSYKSFKLDNPPRYVVDMDGLDFTNIVSQDPESNPWLKSVRFGNPESTHARMVLDLNQDKVHVETECNQAGDTLMISMSNESGVDPLAGISLKGLKTVVLDAGHGGSDPGAQRGDIQEKEITLAITLKLKRYLEEHGMKVRLTRSDDTFVSLEDRVRICREVRPDAFISIHINSLETDRDIQGIETYYQTESSRSLADKIQVKLVDGLKVPNRNVRKARFYVVNHSEQPAVLAEVGFISNKEERDKLISSDYQVKVAESVGQGVILFLTNPAEPVSPAISTTRTSDLQMTNSIVPMLAKQGLSAIKQEETDASTQSAKQIAQKKRTQN